MNRNLRDTGDDLRRRSRIGRTLRTIDDLHRQSRIDDILRAIHGRCWSL